MYNYLPTYWILFFFIYCFLGWIWECFYVSSETAIKTRKWKFINRGFLHGPLIPIYGFAAITILLTTLSVKENLLLVYIIGALTATLFEIVTGTFMEKYFKVKYWDYSDFPLNYNGHICLFVSLFWGMLSVLLIQFIHISIEHLLFKIPYFICEILAFALVVLFGYDFKSSLNEAMDLKDILENLTEQSKTLNRIENRIDSRIAFSPLLNFEDFVEEQKKFDDNIIYDIEKFRERMEDYIQNLKEEIKSFEFDDIVDEEEIMETMNEWHNKWKYKNTRMYGTALKQLKRNPSIRSEKHGEMIELLKNLVDKK